MRHRLGNAVRTVRQGGNTDGVSDTNRGSAKLGFLRKNPPRNSFAAQHDGAPAAVTLRKVSLDGPLEDHTHPFGDKYVAPAVIPQKRLEKAYFVRVQVKALTQAESSLAQNSDKVQLSQSSQSGPLLSDGTSDETGLNPENASSDGVMGGITGDSSEDTKPQASISVEDSNSEAVVRVDVFRQTASSAWKEQPESSITVSLSAVFALHAEISDSVGQMPPPASFATIKPRNKSGSMRHSLAAAFGLTALDTVRITGTLLAGLLRQEPDTGEYKVKSISAYHGKFRLK